MKQLQMKSSIGESLGSFPHPLSSPLVFSMQDIVVTLLTGMLSSKALPGLLSCFPWISYHMELGLGLVPGLPYAILQR